MVIVKENKLGEWLSLIGNTQSWLADKLKISNGYISQIMNGADVSSEMISSLLLLTHFRFESLFEVKPNGENPNHPRHNYEKFNEKED